MFKLIYKFLFKRSVSFNFTFYDGDVVEFKAPFEFDEVTNKNLKFGKIIHIDKENNEIHILMRDEIKNDTLFATKLIHIYSYDEFINLIILNYNSN